MATLGRSVTLQAPHLYSTYRFPVYVSDVLVTRYEWLWVLNNGIMSRPLRSELAVSALPPADNIVVRAVF